jgi:U3 small nucleolar RNA-associated protein 3
MSDEEVLALSNDEDEDEEVDYEELYGNKEMEHEEEEGWGKTKADYYGADEAEDEEAAKQEEEEALRLQRAHLAELGQEDYFEEDDVEEWKKAAKQVDEASLDVVREELPDQDPTLLNATERLNLLKTWYPEALPLAGELQKYAPTLAALKEESSIVGNVKFAALSSYLGTISAYFALFVATVSQGKVSLKDHDVMKGILKAKELWREAEELEAGDEELEELDEEDYEEGDELEGKAMLIDELSDVSDSEGSDDELEGPLVDAKKRKRETVKDSDDEFNVELPKVVRPVKKTKSKTSDYGEVDFDEVDLADKQARKRSLRFYTSKIDQQSQKTNDMYSGDVDLPYKERHFERQQRLMEEARKRGQKSHGYDPTEDFESDGDDRAAVKEINDGFADDYYSAVQAAANRKKDDRKVSHKLAVQAAREGKLEELRADSMGDNEKRAINYQILKNKGLTPKRNKDNRNARVKKRKRYEKAKKKLPSVKQVYRAPTSSYGGESTGIKKNLTRSVRFTS